MQLLCQKETVISYVFSITNADAWLEKLALLGSNFPPAEKEPSGWNASWLVKKAQGNA
jgi:hypothetical protein